VERHEGESRRDAGGETDGWAGEAGTSTDGVPTTAGVVGRPWRKGQSGNPAGRPPRPKASGAPGDRLIGADEPTRSMILAEAYSMIRFTEDGELYEMPANQAVFRALTRMAMSGNRLALARWTRIVREAEREQRAAQTLIYNAMERNDYRRNPNASYDDEIVFDPTNGDALVRGTAE
jgi:hypothetical protein